MEVGEKRCQDDADDEEPEPVHGDEAVYGSDADDVGCHGQLCHHHYLSLLRVEKEELKNMKITQDKIYSTNTRSFTKVNRAIHTCAHRHYSSTILAQT